MYTNPSNIIKSCIKLLERNFDKINKVIQEYEDGRTLSIFEGMRKSLPRDAFPSLEIEPQNVSNEWYSTRSQRPRYSFQMTLTVVNDNEAYGVEYISSIATVLAEILTNPSNLQLKVENEQKYDSDVGLVDTYIQDSLVENMTMSANKDGTIRVIQFDWFAVIHEPFASSAWKYGSLQQPTQIRRDIQVP